MITEPKPDNIWRHKRTGNLYVVADLGYMEADGKCVVIYYRKDTYLQKKWIRPVEEFLEKFEWVESPRCSPPKIG